MDRIQQIQSKINQFTLSSFRPRVSQTPPSPEVTSPKQAFKLSPNEELKPNPDKGLPPGPPPDIRRQVELASKKYVVPENLITAVIKNESNYNPGAISPKGAQGLMQLMPQTAKELGVTNPFDINENIDGGTKYLSQLMGRYDGDLIKAISAYNAGPSQVSTGVPDLKETQSYVKKVMHSYLKNSGVH